MLKELKIVNLALIEELHITLPGGLVVLTGETGAGKSIILQAIHLLSGGKASGNWVRTGSKTGSVEALFEIGPRHHTLREEMRQAGFDAEDEIVIRRILAAGKSRFYVNGGLATAKQAGEITAKLLSVASQHDHQQLLIPRSHLDFIDAVGGHSQQRQQLAEQYDRWQELLSRLLQLHEQEREKERRRDFLSFQVGEIMEAAIQADEDETLARDKELLKSSDTLMRLGQESYQLLTETVTDSLARIRGNLEQMASCDQELSELSEDVSSHAFELEDNLARLRNYIEAIPNDPAGLERISERIDLLQRLKRKYGPSLAEVITHGEQAGRELVELDAMEQQLAELETAVQEIEKLLTHEAGALSTARRQTTIHLAKMVSGQLESLCLEQARFEIEFEGNSPPSLKELTRTGWDRPRFMFSANPGEPLGPLAKIASGGELSRVMLALKCVLARQDEVETVIFDEVDAGISGKAAEAVARKIKELAGHHQVLCITHLPQIASYAHEHFQVIKTMAGERTRTTIANLGDDAKVTELARMLDGDSVTQQTLAYARELFVRNRQN
jgi:DNA repair protein RecN (Recombination protein N)